MMMSQSLPALYSSRLGKHRSRIEGEFWLERAETYGKTYKALEAQRMQMLAEYEQADAALKESE